MKLIYALATVAFSSTLFGANPNYEISIENAISSPSAKNVIALGGHLRGVARHNSSPELNQNYVEIQKALLSIPGHAHYFAEEIRKGQTEVAKHPNDGGVKISYDRNRIKCLETLTHLPSPESVAVLGEFLSDDIDTPIPLVSEGSDTGERLRANSFGASAAISEIGLRDAPAGKGTYDADPDAHLARTRAWWEEVKSGRKSFSFKGQSVEYRFKPDGKWETTALKNAPDDASETKESAVKERPPVRHPQGDQIHANETQRLNPWQWLLGLGVVFLSLFALIGRRFKKH